MKYVFNRVFFISLMATLTACSGSFNLGGSGGGGGRVTSGNIFFTPAVQSSSMDQDLIYNINFINNLIIQDLCGGVPADCDPTLADIGQLLDSYDLEVPESILQGGFELPTSGSAIVLSAKASPVTISNYCTDPTITSMNATVNVNGTPTALMDYLLSYKRIENGSKLKVCDILNLRNELKKELQLSTAARYGYLMTQDQVNETLRLRARREFLYVFVNTFLAFGTDFIGLCQYVGCTVGSSISGAFGTSAAAIDQGINKNKFNVRQVKDSDGDVTVSTTEFFNDNKGNTYLFVEQFFTQGSVIDATNAIIQYEIEENNFCKFVVGSNSSDDPNNQVSSQQYEDNISQCLTASHEYFSKLKFLQKANGEKNIKAIYTDSAYLPEPLTLVNMKYSIDYNSLFEIELENLKAGYLAFMRSELDNHPDIAASLSLSETKYNTLNGITISGAWGIGASITDISGNQALSDSSLPAQIFASVTRTMDIIIPENISDSDVNSLAGNNQVNRIEPGDLAWHMGIAEELIRIEHKRGQTLYQDILGLNVLDLNVKFPPYELTSADFFIFDLSLNEMNGDLKIEKPNALSRFDVKKNGTFRNFMELSNLDLTFKTVELTQPSDTSKRLYISESFGPAWNARVMVDTDSLTSTLYNSVMTSTQGMIGPRDTFDFVVNAPQGYYLNSNGCTDSTCLWFAPAPDTQAIKPVNMTLTGNIASVVNTVGPYSISDKGASFDAAGAAIMNDLLATFPGFTNRLGGSYMGTLTCNDSSTKAVSSNLTRQYSNGQFNQTITLSADGNDVTYGSTIYASGSYGPGQNNSFNFSDYNTYDSYSGSFTANNDNIVDEINVSVLTSSSVSCSGMLNKI